MTNENYKPVEKLSCFDAERYIAKSYEGRRPSQGQRVKIYRNLGHAVPEKFSIVDPKTGLVIGHTDHVILNEVEFTVQPAGVVRANAEKRKNVHAYAVGYLNFAATWRFLRTEGDALLSFQNEISYNPFKSGHFFIRFNKNDPSKDWKIPAGHNAGTVLFYPNGKCYHSSRR